MENFYPKFYRKFKCIAADCPDSCCKGWDVVVDEDSEAYYNGLDGKFAEKIKNVTATDEDGDRIFTLDEDRCPFWNKDRLCDIYINLGEEHLCKTCRSFPRIVNDFGTFKEHSLSLACPEAVRLILDGENSFSEYSGTREISDEEYDGELMEFLLEARAETINILTENNSPFVEGLISAIEYNIGVQEQVDGFVDHYTETEDFSFVAEVYKELDYIDEMWKNNLENLSIKCNNEHDGDFAKLAEYYVYRYYLNSIGTGYVLSTLKRIVCTYLIINSLSELYNFQAAVQQYSKEVEHSYENDEYLGELFETDGRFSAENLINNLRRLQSEDNSQEHSE